MQRRWVIPVLVVVALLALPVAALVAFDPPEPGPVSSAVPSVTEAPPPMDTPVATKEGLRRVDGTVVGAEGEPVVGARVAVKGSRQTAKTGGDGSFRLRGVALEAVTVTADADGFARGTVQVQEGETGDVATVTIELERAEGARGTVIDPGGQPISRANVSCEDRSDDPLLGAVTGPEGEFTMPPRAVGCRAVATKRGFEPSDVLVLRAGAGNELRLGEPASIAGTVTDDDGRPVEGAVVAIERYLREGKTERIRKRVRTDGEGSFTLEGLAAGTYTLVASAPGRPPTTGEPIEVATKEAVAGVRIELSRGAMLSGVVTDAETGEPVAGVAVSLDGASYAGANRIRPARTDDEGRYELDGVPEGPFSVKFDARGYAARVISGVETSGRDEVTRDAELAPGSGTEYSGIAALLAMADGRPSIGKAMEGGPAAEAGLQRGDVIVMIDGVDTQGMTMSDAVQTLRGPSGSTVRITVEREGRRLDVVVERAPFTR